MNRAASLLISGLIAVGPACSAESGTPSTAGTGGGSGRPGAVASLSAGALQAGAGLADGVDSSGSAGKGVAGQAHTEVSASSDAGEGGGDAGSTTPTGAAAILNQSCMTSAETKPCWVCEEERCCQTYEVFAGVAEGKQFAECDGGCEHDPACIEACWREYPAGADAYAPRLACLQALCASECGVSDPGFLCTAAHCALELVSLIGTAKGLVSYSCEAACETLDQACRDKCFAMYPETEQPALELTACALANCADVQ